jgi:hypothetical protein
VAYAAASTERFPSLILGIGVFGLAIAGAALLTRWSPLLPLGLVCIGGAYAVALALRSVTVDPRAPFVAAGLFAAAELGYFSLDWRTGRPEVTTIVRQLLVLVGGALAAVIVGGVVLVAASGTTWGVGLDAVGVGAALIILGLLAVLSFRASA